MKKQILILTLVTFTIQTEFMAKCETTPECIDKYNTSYSCFEGRCHHTRMLPFTSNKIFGVVLIIIVSALANAGGIGGGAIIIPIYTFIFNFTVGDSIPLSKATILSGALVNLILSYNNRLIGDKNKLAINYKLAGFIVPLILGGTMLGIMFTKLLPSVLIFSVLILYLFTSVYKIFKKARELDAKEDILQKEKDKKEKLDEIQELKDNKNVGKNIKIQELDGFKINKVEDTSVKSFDELIEPYKKNLILCVSIYFLILFVALIRGGEGFESLIGINSCSMISWVLFFATEIICFLGSYHVYKQEKEKSLKKANSNMVELKNARKENLLILEDKNKKNEEEEEEDGVTPTLLYKLFINTYVAGILAGTLGIGGGMVINPVLLKEKFSPEVSAAVSGFVVFFTSLSTTTQFIIAGAFDLEFAFFIFIFSGIGSFIGNVVFKRVLKYYNKPSILVWVLFLLLGLSACILPPVGAFKIAQQDNAFVFGTPC